MADVREMLGRLNAQTIKMDIGRGGTAELTNQDIAAALGMVDAGLGRELLEACWWPDGAALRRTQLRDAVLDLVQPELRRQAALLTDARTSYGIACACIGWSGPVTREQLAEKERAAARLDQVQLQCWPRNAVESLPTLVRAVITEMAQRALCSDCNGHGEVALAPAKPGKRVRSCVTCAGSGAVPVSDRRRAAAIGRDESTYRAKWRGMYVWLLSHFREAESRAAGNLKSALSK